MGPNREGRVRLAMASQVVETCGDSCFGKGETYTKPRRIESASRKR